MRTQVFTRLGNRLSVLRQISPPLLALILAILLFFAGGLVNPNFVNFDQATNIVRLAAFLGIIASGQTLVIISGNEGIDLSSGAVITLSAILVYRISNGENNSLAVALAVALAAGAIIGAINGLGVTMIGIPPLVMTLGMTGIVEGTILKVTQGRLLGEVPPILNTIISAPLIGSIPGVVILWVLLGLVLWLVLNRTPYGKQLYAIGSNRTAARLSGVRVKPTVVFTYMLSGVLAAFSGFILLGYNARVFLNLGAPYVFPSIAAVVVGGTVMSGGKGSYFGSMSGALVLTLIETLLRGLGLQEAYQYIVTGAILLVLLTIYGRQRNLRQ